jgi:hypothetical protein
LHDEWKAKGEGSGGGDVDESVKKEIKVWEIGAKEGIHTVTVIQYFQYLCSKNSAICDRLSESFYMI